MSLTFNLEDLGEDISDRVAEFTLSEDRKTLTVDECCDTYFMAELRKPQVRLLIDRLQAMYDQMEDA